MSAIDLSASLLHSMPLPMPSGSVDKNTRGSVLSIAGSGRVPGAALLCATAVLRSGAGKVQLAVPRSIAATVGVAFPEGGVVALAETEDGEPAPHSADFLCSRAAQLDAVLIGPGLAEHNSAAEITDCLLQTESCPALVIDAGALSGLWSKADLVRPCGDRVIITPNTGEMAALLGRPKEEIDADPLSFARRVSEHLGCTTVLKGAATHIATRDGSAWRHDGGVIGLATGGSGDVLAGLLAGLVARGTPPVRACLWSVFIHAQAGVALSRSVGELGFLAREMPALFPKLLMGGAGG